MVISGPRVDATICAWLRHNHFSQNTITTTTDYTYTTAAAAAAIRPLPPSLPVVIPFIVRDGSGKRASRVDGATVDGDHDHVVCGQRVKTTAAGKSDNNQARRNRGKWIDLLLPVLFKKQSFLFFLV